MATFTIKLNAASEYTFYNNAELDICQEVEDFSKTQYLITMYRFVCHFMVIFGILM